MGTRWILYLVPVVFVFAVGGALLWWHASQEDPDPDPPPTSHEGDTGFSRAETEARMRAIGYVQ